MSYRQIKAPALAKDAVTYDALRPGVILNQPPSTDISELVSGIDTNTLLLHVASTGTLSKLTIADLSSTITLGSLVNTIIATTNELIKDITSHINLTRSQTTMIGIMETTRNIVEVDGIVIDFVASGAIYNGAPVIIKVDGKIETVNDNLTSDNFIGMSTKTYSDGDIARVLLQGGVSTNQTGLSPGSTYYVQTNGSLLTTPDNPSVIAGKALSATSILLKGI
jgi:hypothetical protein